MIFGFSKGLTSQRPKSVLTSKFSFLGLHTLLMVFAEKLLLHLEYSRFVINFIILKIFILNIILLLLGEWKEEVEGLLVPSSIAVTATHNQNLILTSTSSHSFFFRKTGD